MLDEYDFSAMREVVKTDECNLFIKSQDERFKKKFEFYIEIIETKKIIPSNIVKQIKNSKFYELRIKTNNEYRILIFTIGHNNIQESESIILVNGFIKKGKKDYKKAIEQAENILFDYDI